MKVKAVKSFVSNSICMAIGEVMEFPDAKILPFINAGLAVVYTETGKIGNAPNNTVQEAVVSKKIELTKAVYELNFNEDGNNPLFYISNPYCYIRNFSSNDCAILASVTNSNISNVDKNTEDGTVLIVGKEIRRLKLNSSNKIYLTSGNGAAVAEICTSDSPISPWNI